MEFKKYIAESLVGIREILAERSSSPQDIEEILPSEKRGEALYKKYASERVDIRALKAIEEAYVSSSSFKELEDTIEGIYKAASNEGLEDTYEIKIYQSRIEDRYV